LLQRAAGTRNRLEDLKKKITKQQKLVPGACLPLHFAKTYWLGYSYKIVQTQQNGHHKIYE
jgi:hypothetical protein